MRVEEENERCSYNWQSLGDGVRESIGSLANAKRTSAAAERRLMERVGGGQNDGRTRLEEDRGGHSRDGLKWSMISMGERGGGKKWKQRLELANKTGPTPRRTSLILRTKVHEPGG